MIFFSTFLLRVKPNNYIFLFIEQRSFYKICRDTLVYAICQKISSESRMTWNLSSSPNEFHHVWEASLSSIPPSNVKAQSTSISTFFLLTTAWYWQKMKIFIQWNQLEDQTLIYGSMDTWLLIKKKSQICTGGMGSPLQQMMLVQLDACI